MAPTDRWLVIGAGGLVGRHVVDQLADRHVTGTYHRAEGTNGGPLLDVTDRGAVERLIARERPEVIVLAAADAYVERCEREPRAAWAVNVEGARTVAQAAAAADAAFVAFSSEYVFDGTAGPYHEDDATHPINEYGRQKAALESIAAAVPRHLICRLSGVFGWEPARKNFVCQVVDALRAGRTFAVAHDQVITPTYAPDLAKALTELVDMDARGTFHVVGPRVIARLEFAHMIAEAFDLRPDRLRGISTMQMGLAAARPLRAGLSDAKLRTTIGHGLRAPEAALARMALEEPR
jgi:dTDP-4-dehydrorhamnose reductase